MFGETTLKMDFFNDKDFKNLQIEFLLKYKMNFTAFIFDLNKLSNKYGITDNTKYNKDFAREFKKIYKMDIIRFSISLKKLLKKHNYKLLKDGKICKIK